MFQRIILLISILCFTACKQDKAYQISDLNGYWEIVIVKKGSTILKEYTISTSIDYFEMKNDSVGFKKKVMPTLEGKYLVSQHQLPFSIISVGNAKHLHYTLDDNEIEEVLVKLSKDELIITNDQDLTYIYKPFEALNLDL